MAFTKHTSVRLDDKFMSLWTFVDREDVEPTRSAKRARYGD